MSAPSAAARASVVVVDTDVVSFIHKQHSLAAAYHSLVAGHSLTISFMTLAETARWAEERNWGPTLRARLQQTLTRFIVLYPDAALCETWGGVMGASKR